MQEPANDKVERLFFGDKRLDNLYHALRDEIQERLGGQNIPAMTVVGVIEKIKLDIIKEVFWDET